MRTQFTNMKMIGFTMVSHASHVSHVSPIPRKLNEVERPRKLNEAERVVYSNFLNECLFVWNSKLGTKVVKDVEHKCNENIWGIWLNEMY